MTQPVAYPSTARAWWAMTVLFLAYTMSFVDRTILSLLVEPLRRDLLLTDTEISLLHGLAFAIFYSTMGLPIAILADRKSRRMIIAIGVFFWSLMTVACGFANSFWKLFAARLGVGVGEAALSPATYSLIADMFPENKRGRALGFFAGGIHVGAGMALIVGGAVIGIASEMGTVTTFFGEFRSWQLVFMIVGVPGLFVALLALTIPEPRRTAGPAVDVHPDGQAFTKFLSERKAAIAFFFVALSICGLMFGGFNAWAPTFLIRHYGFTPAESGKALGIAVLIWGTLGALAGGALSDRWAHLPDGTMRVALVGMIMQTITGVSAPLVSNPDVAIALFSVMFFFGGFSYPAGAAGVQKMTPAPLRARMSALYLMVVSIIGAAFGPTTIALLTDKYFMNPADLGYSMAITAGVLGPIGCITFLLGLKPFAHAIRTQTHQQ